MKKNKDKLQEEIDRVWNAEYPENSKIEIELSWERFRSKLSTDRERRFKRRRYYSISGVAAALLLVFGSYFFLILNNPIIHFANNSPIDKEVVLPDGSLVLLETGSEIEYQKRFGNIRKVGLVGHAFFDVVKDSLKEFHVVTESATVKVLGTSFSVTEKERSEKLEISLYTGRVMVSLEDKTQSWNIIPGEKLFYDDGKVFITKFDTNLSFEPGNKFIDINDLELEKLFSFLSSRFGYVIHDSSYLKNQKVTLRINREDSLEHILNVLSNINSVTYEINSKTKEITVKQ
ncbi:FecR family protein [Arenibacter palladensis]|uniref:FecR family protein n=1 Tax=Arenibacter palladensis TaxID=237373 RepID=UPI002FD541A7